MFTCHLDTGATINAYGLKKFMCIFLVSMPDFVSFHSIYANLIFLSFLDYHLKGRNEAHLNSSFNMTCHFEIAQIIMYDCHVEL